MRAGEQKPDSRPGTPRETSRRPPSIPYRLALAWLAFLLPLTAADATEVEVTGRFLYEDRIWDSGGYTGTVQDLPIRHADIELVEYGTGNVLCVGSTDADGGYALSLELGAASDLYVRCLSAAENDPHYPVWVVDTFVNLPDSVDISESAIHAITTEAQPVIPENPSSWEFGEYVSQDRTGFGVAQAFNIFDTAIDCCDFLADPIAIGRYPDQSEYIVYAWNGSEGTPHTGYIGHGIWIASWPTDTNGWADTVILHETGHWVTHMFSLDHNPGGNHTIGDNYQDPRLAFGEGYASYFSGELRDYRSARLNQQGDPIDSHVSLIADLTIPPPLPEPGGMVWYMDFETALLNGETPIDQIGSANETNVNSAMWDLIDGPATLDESIGLDDDPADAPVDWNWDVLRDYIAIHGLTDWLTIEDFHDGWFIIHGPGFLEAEVESIFVAAGGMPFCADVFEPDNSLAEAREVIPLTYDISEPGGVVINEVDLGSHDAVELYNSGSTPVNLTGWQIITYRNEYPFWDYTIPEFTLYPGMLVSVRHGASQEVGPVYIRDPFFRSWWESEDDGACILEDDQEIPIDFLRWDNVSGEDPNDAPTPPGLEWEGTLYSAPAGKNLARDRHGTDTDRASDFSPVDSSLGAPNFRDLPRHTVYPQCDEDVIRIDLTAGDLLVVRALAPHSAGEPVLELLNADGSGRGLVSASHGLPYLAEIQLLAAGDETIFARLTNAAPYTFYAPVDLAVFKRPLGDILWPPAGLAATADHLDDANDPIHLSWFNGGTYDSLRVCRDDDLLATLPGDATGYEDSADRGLYRYLVQGFLSGIPSQPASCRAFAGTVPCYTGDGFESGNANLLLEGSWAITTLLAAEGLCSLTDSPLGDYPGSSDMSAELIEPALLMSDAFLEFDHICITEARRDFGCVELSRDCGTTWLELARYDMDHHPGWEDGTADPEDWVHETIDLQQFLGEMVRVRFRLRSDDGWEYDGWYIDNVRISTENCLAAAPEDGAMGEFGPLLRIGSNPFRNCLDLSLTRPAGGNVTIEVFDVRGRLIRVLHDGFLKSEASLTWDGRDVGGIPASSGLYWIRARTGWEDLTRRVVLIR